MAANVLCANATTATRHTQVLALILNGGTS